MAIKIKFDLVGNPESPTIILANRNGNKLGQLKVNADSIELIDKFNDASEMSFTINKYIDNKLTPLWEKVVDFKLIYCKEWNAWFEIKVELDEETETVKTVFCTQLGQAELSQIMLYNIEINTEKDIERDDYKISILYDENNPEASILNRILKDKAPHYSIKHVSSTIEKIQRSFSFDGTSILDAFNEIAEEIGCLFQYDAAIDDNGRLQRTISVYDLKQYCIDCGYRGDFTDKCSKCGSTDIIKGYGDDTLIFVTSDELASEGIQLVTDTDSVKNCFKLEAGDDLMTATVRNCNPNGTDYIWYFSDAVKEDMSDELVSKLNSYDEMYKEYYNNAKSSINYDQLVLYNRLVNKYSPYNEKLQKITTPITGYSSLMNAYYNTIDLALYLKSGLMPSIEMSETSAEEQASLLTSSSLSSVAVDTKNISSISLATANSAVLSMAKIIVKSTYKVEVATSTLSSDSSSKVWNGEFVITNYSDDEDTFTTETISVRINNDAESFIKQKIDKALNKEDVDDYSISGLFKKNYDDFCNELKKYALNPLNSFYDACDACLNILIDQGAGNKDEKPDLYKKLYEPYYNKSSAIAAEIKLREDEIVVIEGVWDKTDEENPVLITKGLQQYIEECRDEIQESLDFEKHLGEELLLEFCAYRREDTYSNDNYISDGLNNAELFKKAQEFYEVAENEIYKSAELQCSISTTLNNLLAIDKFKPLVDSFENGNWIRVQVDGGIYKLRLLEYQINFGSFENIPVEFSEVTKIKNGITDVESILSQASSMATSYSYTQKQAIKGDEAKASVDKWLTNGLNSALVQIQSNDDEEITFTKNGLLCRSYNDIDEAYSDKQFKLTHNIMAYTTDNWKTVSAALGEHEYSYYDSNKKIQNDIDYGLSAKFVNAGYINGSQIIGGEIYSQNYASTTGTYMNLNDGNFSWAGGRIKYDGNAVTLSGVTIQWEYTNAPEVTVDDVSGLDGCLSQFKTQLDGRAQTWYQNSDPSTEWTTDELRNLHVGDLWHYTGDTGKVNGFNRIKDSEWVWKEVNGAYQWDKIQISDEVFDLIDGKAQIFVSQPSNYKKNDMWILDVENADGKNTEYPEYKKGTLLVSSKDNAEYSSNDWSEPVRYTDDTKANSAYDLAYNAKIIGNKLVNGLGFQETEITGSYVISPVIAGGTLLIGDKSGTYAQITTDGKLTCTGAEVSGKVTATKGQIGGWNLGSSLIYKNSYDSDKNITHSAAMRSNSSMAFAVYEKSGEQTGAPSIDDTWNYNFYVSYEGKLFSNNALIYGTVYATDGEFSGKITANEGEVGGWKIDKNRLCTEVLDDSGASTNKQLYFASANATGYNNWIVAKNDNGESTFLVSKEGYLTASGAKISGSLTVDAKTGSTVQISANGNDDSFINFGEAFAVSKNGVSAISGDFGSLLVGGKKVLTEDNLDTKIVISKTKPTRTGVIWIKPNSVGDVKKVDYQMYTYDERNFDQSCINNRIRTFNVTCNTSDVLQDTKYKYTVKFPVILVYDGDSYKNIVFSVTATKSSDDSKKVIFNDYTLSSIHAWGVKNIEMTIESDVNLCQNSDSINVSIKASGCGTQQNRLYVDKEKYIYLTAESTSSTTSGEQTCTVHYIP